MVKVLNKYEKSDLEERLFPRILPNNRSFIFDGIFLWVFLEFCLRVCHFFISVSTQLGEI